MSDQGHLTPLGGFIDEQNEVANLLDFESCAGNACLGQKIVRIEKAGEVEASTGRVKAARFVGKLLLLVDPCAVKRRLKLRHLGLARRRADVCTQSVKEVIKFQDAGGRVLERRGNHADMMVSRSRGLRENAVQEASRLREKPASTSQNTDKL